MTTASFQSQIEFQERFLGQIIDRRNKIQNSLNLEFLFGNFHNTMNISLRTSNVICGVRVASQEQNFTCNE
jgi:hypothetical protein